jgi:hypothetical protein
VKGVFQIMLLSAIAFCKRATCPSSQILLAYRTRGLEAEQVVWVSEHLDKCDFCGAELQLLTEHAPPAEEEESTLVDMPLNLRCLAKSILTADWRSIESLAETAYEKERLTLTDA